MKVLYSVLDNPERMQALAAAGVSEKEVVESINKLRKDAEQSPADFTYVTRKGLMKDIIIEGVDRLGKSTLITNLQHRLGFFQGIHYAKPQLLDVYYNGELDRLLRENRDAGLDPQGVNFDARVTALRQYQQESFSHMLALLSQPGRHIMDRAHLGEAVYAHRYRHYDGNYVFDLERHFTHDRGSSFADTTLLVLLTTSDFSFITDDGLSLDFAKKEEEQEDFKRAFARSTIKNKLLLDVSNGQGGYRDPSEILTEVINAYTNGTTP